jgi:transposase
LALAAAGDPNARRLMTHPGVGALTAVATGLVLGPPDRFPHRKHVVSYVGVAPAVSASGDKCRLGHITKQGSTLLRWILGPAAPLAARADADLKRLYFTLLHRRGRPKARVALARNLLDPAWAHPTEGPGPAPAHDAPTR